MAIKIRPERISGHSFIGLSLHLFMHSGKHPWIHHLCQQIFISHKALWALRSLQDICWTLWSPQWVSRQLVPLVDSWLYVREKSHLHLYCERRRWREKKALCDVFRPLKVFCPLLMWWKSFSDPNGDLKKPLTWEAQQLKSYSGIILESV